MTAKEITSRDAVKRLTTDLARHLLGIDAEAIQLLETQNQRVDVDGLCPSGKPA